MQHRTAIITYPDTLSHFHALLFTLSCCHATKSEVFCCGNKKLRTEGKRLVEILFLTLKTNSRQLQTYLLYRLLHQRLFLHNGIRL